MFGFSLGKFHIYPHHSDYIMLTHECGWSEDDIDGGISLKDIMEKIQKHCDECKG